MFRPNQFRPEWQLNPMVVFWIIFIVLSLVFTAAITYMLTFK